MRKLKLIGYRELRDSREFFELKLPPAFTWFLYGTLVLLLTAFAWSWFGEMDVIVRGASTIRLKQNLSVIKNSSAGPVAEKLFHQGQLVKEGQILWRIDSKPQATDIDESQRQLARNRKQLEEVRLLQQSIQAGRNLVSPSNKEAYSRAEYFFSERSRLSLNVEKAKVVYEKALNLPSTLVATKKTEETERDYKLAQLELDSWILRQKSSLDQDQITLTNDAGDLDRRLATLNRQKLDTEVRAPITGFVDEIKKFNQGDFLLVGEEVLRIVPQEAQQLKVEIIVDNQDIAQIKPGMKFVMRFEALPPTEYGTITGTITLVPKDASIPSNAQPIFVLEGTMDRIQMQNRQGETVQLRAGMTADTRIILKQKKILYYILEKLDFIS